MHNNRCRACLSVRHTFATNGWPGAEEVRRRKSFVAELLRDGLEFQNAILQDGSR